MDLTLLPPSSWRWRNSGRSMLCSRRSSKRWLRRSEVRSGTPSARQRRCASRPRGRLVEDDGFVSPCTGGCAAEDRAHCQLLRVLQEGEFERLGDETTRRVDVRIIAATNRDLQQEVIEHRFRLDLFYRLGVFPIATPPLRDRRDDIPQLIQHFLQQCCDRLHVQRPKLPMRELERAQAYDWPGNIRELQNVVERATILARGGALVLLLPDSGPDVRPAVRPAALPDPTGPSSDILTERQWRDLERTNVRRALERANFRIYGPGGAAALLGTHGATLASRLKKFGITRAPS